MLEKAFELAVVISAVDRFTGPMKKFSAQTEMATKKAAELQKRLGKFKNMAIVGGAMTVAGGAMTNGLIKAVEKAGEFQSKLITIQGITGATTSQMNKLSNAIMNVSSKVTMFNDMQVSGFAQQLASGGFKKASDVQKLLLPVSQFAEVQKYEGKADPQEAVKMAINMAHMFKHYDAASMKKYLNAFNKYSVMEPGSSQDLYQTLSYLAPTAYRQLHMPESDVMALAAIANRVGLKGSHGGTNAADMILRLVPGLIGGTPTATKMPKAWNAMLKLGLINQKGKSKFFKSGHIVDLQGMLQTLIKASKNYSTPELAKYYHDIFGIQGGRAASIMSDKSTIEQLKSMEAQLKTTKSIQQFMAAYSKSTEGQINMLKSNAMTAMLRFAMQLMPVLNPILARLNSMVKAFMKFEEAHPKLLKLIGRFATWTAGILLTVGVVQLLTGVLGYLFTGGIIGEGARLLIRAFTGMLGPITLLIGAGYLLYKAWMHDWGGIREKAAGALRWIKTEIPIIEMKIKRLALSLGLISKGKFHIPEWLKWGAAIFLGIKGLTGLVSGINMILGPFAALTRFVGSGGTMLRGIISFGSWIMRITGLTKLWTAVQAAFNIVMDMNPIGLIIIGVAALTVGIVLLVKHWKTVVHWLKNAWAWFKHLNIHVQVLIASFVPFIGIPALILAHWKPIETFLQHLFNMFKNGPWKHISDFFSHIFGGSHHASASLSIATSGANPLSQNPNDLINNNVGNSSSTVHIHPGAIQINGISDPKAAVDEMMKRLGQQSRTNNMSRPSGPNRLVFGN